jgi:uronate dehydrogenase
VDQRVLITGAGGRIGRMLRDRLVRPGRVLRLIDRGAQSKPADGEAVELLTGDITDPATMAAACAGVDAVIHLGALKTENTWENLIRINVDGTRTVLEAACGAGVPRVVLASSVHAVGFYRRPGSCPEPAGIPVQSGPDGVPELVPVRPDSYYGVSKAAVEALGSLFADRFGMTVFALRLGDCTPEPPGEWALHSWLSPNDCARLVEACLAVDEPGYRMLWGISRNTRRWWSLAAGEAIGYHPQDDAEEYADKVPPAVGDRAATMGLLGGRHTTVALGVPR